MKERLDLVLVDEFQDTSPIQLELFLKLAVLAKNSIWVGDQKQSIFEFRGADPMLMQSVLDAIKTSDRLPKSFRSRPQLVELVNKTFESVFPKQAITENIKLESDRREILKTPALESWLLRTKSIDADTQAIARRISEILADPAKHPVIDRRSGAQRPIAPADVCVLARNNDTCVKLAECHRRMRSGRRARAPRSDRLSGSYSHPRRTETATQPNRFYRRCTAYLPAQRDRGGA